MGVTANRHEVSFGILTSIALTLTQLCEFITNHCIVCTKSMSKWHGVYISIKLAKSQATSKDKARNPPRFL